MHLIPRHPPRLFNEHTDDVWLLPGARPLSQPPPPPPPRRTAANAPLSRKASTAPLCVCLSALALHGRACDAAVRRAKRIERRAFPTLLLLAGACMCLVGGSYRLLPGSPECPVCRFELIAYTLADSRTFPLCPHCANRYSFRREKGLPEPFGKPPVLSNCAVDIEGASPSMGTHSLTAKCLFLSV